MGCGQVYLVVAVECTRAAPRATHCWPYAGQGSHAGMSTRRQAHTCPSCPPPPCRAASTSGWSGALRPPTAAAAPAAAPGPDPLASLAPGQAAPTPPPPIGA